MCNCLLQKAKIVASIESAVKFGGSIMKAMRVALVVAALFAIQCFPCMAFADDYPSHPLQLVVPWSPGGSSDTMARTYSGLLEKYLGASVVVQNKPGASGLVGCDYALSKPADGYTLLLCAAEPSIFRAMGMAKVNYGDFTPIAQLSTMISTVTVRPDAPWKTLKEFIDYAKAHPGEIKVAHSGPGTDGHLAAVFFGEITGVKFHQVSYGSGDRVRIALMGSQVDVVFNALTEMIEPHKAGKAKILATITAEPVPGLNVPAIVSEAPDFKEVLPWGPIKGIMVKKGTPADVVAKIIDASKKVLTDPKWLEFLKNVCAVPSTTTGEEFGRVLTRDESVKAWLLFDDGAAVESPENFGVKKVR